MTPKRPKASAEPDPELIKAALQEALKEWLDDKFTQFGKWTLGGISAMAFAMVVWFFFFSHGWRMPQ